MPTRIRHPPKSHRRARKTPALADFPQETWPQIRLHIAQMWPMLTRDIRHAAEAARDTKTADLGPRVPIYVSAAESPESIAAHIEKVLTPGDFDRLAILPLPGAPEQIVEHGLLYLPGRYVVPGGRFNELYGWDSHFIVLGLLREGRTGLAQSVVDQCLYEVEHYGAVLNCNRTYCLSRSHPPFLSRSVRAVFAQSGDIEWLGRALPLIEHYHAYWQSPPHFVAATGLSRYHAMGEGPAPEVVHGEVDADGEHHYRRVCARLRREFADAPWLAGIYASANDELTPDGYRNDRTVRESGFDLTDRFGPCGLRSRDVVPVCLNSLLWCLEVDIAEIRRRLGSSVESVARWESLAVRRAERMIDCFWDSEAGMFFDWNLARGERSTYRFATTFMPLWAGWATREQAAGVARCLGDFMAPAGLMASVTRSGCQWDAPFTWAPLVLMAVEGLAAYGYVAEAMEVGGRFLSVAAREFLRTGQFFEKYDAEEVTADVGDRIRYGYPTNEAGFGWTNAVIGELLATLGLEAEDKPLRSGRVQGSARV